MPQLIHHIDAIARKKQRGVLWITFEDPIDASPQDVLTGLNGLLGEGSSDYEDNPSRQQVIAWLEEHHIAWEPSAEYANPNCFISYQGQIYVDLPYDVNLPAYRELEFFLENPDVSKRPPGVRFWILPLELAMRNAEHDEPGYWERAMKDI